MTWNKEFKDIFKKQDSNLENGQPFRTKYSIVIEMYEDGTSTIVHNIFGRVLNPPVSEFECGFLTSIDDDFLESILIEDIKNSREIKPLYYEDATNLKRCTLPFYEDSNDDFKLRIAANIKNFALNPYEKDYYAHHPNHFEEEIKCKILFPPDAIILNPTWVNVGVFPTIMKSYHPVLREITQNGKERFCIDWHVKDIVLGSPALRIVWETGGRK